MQRNGDNPVHIHVKYQEDRTAENLVKSVQKKLGELVTTLTTATGVMDFKDDSDVSVVGFFRKGQVASM